jgi:hypothetical protein
MFVALATVGTYRLGMHVLAWLLPLLLAASDSTGRGASRPNDTFHASVEPILKQRCTPCHFAGGKMYGKLPFDRPETIVTLGERLFTRIKDDDQRAVIRKFLAEQKQGLR